MNKIDLRINGVAVHPSVTPERVCEAVQTYALSLENPGICIVCGNDAEGCEPDAEQYKCEHCEERGVYGAEQLLFYMEM